MTAEFVRFIPADHTYMPDYLGARRGKELLEALLPDVPAEHIAFKMSPNPSLVGNGGSPGGVRCPLCGAELGEIWWQDAVGDAYRDDFWELAVTVPCCGGETSLNHLAYERHVGFARFVLEVTSPGGSVPEEALEKLAALYGQPFCVVQGA